MKSSLDCPKCGSVLVGPGRTGGRPTRFCCEGCKVSAEAEMRRLNVLLRKIEERRAVETITVVARVLDRRGREKSLAAVRARHDDLIGELQPLRPPGWRAAT